MQSWFGKRSVSLFLFLCVLPLLGDHAVAWWEKGHEIVVENAVAKLPEDMPRFIKDHVAALKDLSVVPDQWKTQGAELKHSEEPNHYIDLEKVTNDPRRLGFEKDRYKAMERYFKRKETPRSVGLLPFQIIEYYQRMVIAFAKSRKHPTSVIFQAEIIHYAGILSHYAGDLSQPLHTTIHHDGRVGKDGKAIKNKGVHSRFEGHFVDTYIDGKDCLPYIKPPVPFDDIHKAIREGLAQSFERIDELYKFDDAHKFESSDPAAIKFVQKRLAHGSQFLLELWYSAWKESEKL